MKSITKILFIALMPAALLLSCKKDLNVGNPNQPTINDNVKDENGLIALTSGGVYLNGIGNGTLDWLGNSYASLPFGYSELLGDMLSAEAANQIVDRVNVPDAYTLDPGTSQPVVNDAPMRAILRTNNNRPSSSQGNNPFLYIWVSMYQLNNACNSVLGLVDKVSYTGDANTVDTKKNTIKAFCYFWKGWAYANIGSQYYAGLIVDQPNATNGNYKASKDIIAESNSNYLKCKEILNGITAGNTAYADVLGRLIPSFCQVGNGGILSPDEWNRNINTLLARNILVNKLSPFVNNNPASTITGSSMENITAADWNQILTYANDGIKMGDKVFTGRSAEVNGFMSASSGNIAAQATGPASPATFKIGERFIQNFKSGKVQSVAVVSGGSGYFSGTQIRFSAPDYGRDTAKGTVILGVGGAITGIQIDNPGSGYYFPPSTNLTDAIGGTPSGAGGQLGTPVLLHCDKRFTNNFERDNYGMIATFSTRFAQVDGGNGMSGVYVYGNKNVGAYEVYLAGSYEENELMLAEAKIRTGNVDAGLVHVDNVRGHMGAGIPAVSGTSLNTIQALSELVRERRVALVYRGLSYFDSRRWGWIYDISKGGGAFSQTIIDGSNIYNNATINYNFLDYWDVPADEFDFNPPAAGSAPIKNPN